MSKKLRLSVNKGKCYLSYERCICERRSNFCAQVELLIINYICRQKWDNKGLASVNTTYTNRANECWKQNVKILFFFFRTLAHGAAVPPPYGASSEHVIGSEDWRGFGEGGQGCGRCRGALRKAHRRGGFSQRSRGKSYIGCQIHLVEKEQSVS